MLVYLVAHNHAYYTRVVLIDFASVEVFRRCHEHTELTKSTAVTLKLTATSDIGRSCFIFISEPKFLNIIFMASIR